MGGTNVVRGVDFNTGNFKISCLNDGQWQAAWLVVSTQEYSIMRVFSSFKVALIQGFLALALNYKTNFEIEDGGRRFSNNIYESVVSRVPSMRA